MPARIVFLAAALAIGATSATAQSDGPTSTQDGVYTDAQAERGSRVYANVCKECHEPDFFAQTLQAWAGAPLSILYDLITSTMPQDNPGGLPPTQYADVLAYIFQSNGLPAGTRELPANSADLISIIIER